MRVPLPSKGSKPQLNPLGHQVGTPGAFSPTMMTGFLGRRDKRTLYRRAARLHSGQTDPDLAESHAYMMSLEVGRQMIWKTRYELMSKYAELPNPMLLLILHPRRPMHRCCCASSPRLSPASQPPPLRLSLVVAVSPARKPRAVHPSQGAYPVMPGPAGPGPWPRRPPLRRSLSLSASFASSPLPPN